MSANLSSIDRVKSFYNNNLHREDQRLTKDYYHRIEFEVTKHFINKYLNEKSKVIDIGGGSGKYTMALLEKGHDVTLVDLSKELLEIAKQEITSKKLAGNLDGIFECNATSLNSFQDNCYDCSLLFGPLYHLITVEDRSKAISETYRVTKPGGLIFCAVVTRLAPIRDILTCEPEVIRNCLHNEKEKYEELLNTGVHKNLSQSPNAFTDAYFSKTEEVPKMFKEHNINLIESFSCEGIASFFGKKIDDIVDNNEDTWRKLLDIIISTSTEPSILGSGEHTVYIGQKK